MRLEWWEKAGIGVLLVLGVFMSYLMFVVIPTAMYTEAECLRKGYPKSSVTIGLERYCMSMDGAVTIGVRGAARAETVRHK